MKGTPAVVVVGSHRSGTSVVMGLLSISGLHLGDVIPATEDNPKGYFESVAALDADRRLLATMGRDWTCPPARLPWDLDTSVLEDAVEEIVAEDRRWGFKDPRSMFLLPAWADVIDSFQFIGVYRPTMDVAASLTRRDGFASETAEAIALLYNERLRFLHETFQFPIVRYGGPAESLIDRVSDVADRLELHLDRDGAETFVSTARASATQDPVHEVDGYLAAAATAPIDDIPVVSSEMVKALERRTGYGDLPEVPTTLALAHVRRRRFLWTSAVRVLSSIGHVISLEPGPGTRLEMLPGVDNHSLEWLDVDELASRDRRPASHIVGSGILDRTHPDELISLLDLVSDAAAKDAVVVLDGFVLDGSSLPAERRFRRVDASASRIREPFLHHVDELFLAGMKTGWQLVRVIEDPFDGTRAEFTFVRGEFDLDDPYASPPLARQLLADADAAASAVNLGPSPPAAVISNLDEDLGEARSEIRALSEKALRLREEADAHIERIGVLDAIVEERLAENQAQEDQLANLAGLPDQLAARKRELELVTAKLASTEAAASTVRASLEKANQRIAKLERNYERLRNRRSVRFLLKIASFIRPVFQWWRGLRKRRANAPEKAASPAAVIPERQRRSQEATTRAIRSARPDAGPSAGPLVSIVVLTRDGKHHMERLLRSLESDTAYRSFELIVVDNGSSDGTGGLLSEDRDLDVIHIRNEGNASFSAGCNQGLDQASGKYTLLLNNDVEPINAGWLGSMVSTLEDDEGSAACGALLVYPKAARSDSREEQEFALTVQHRGIAFQKRAGTVLGYNLGRGEDPTDDSLADIRVVPGVTAACMLVRTDVLRGIGGLDERYIYGYEDVDLNLRLRMAGHQVVIDGRAALYHHEFGTQDDHGGHTRRAYRMSNRQFFAERWARFLHQKLIESLLGESDLDWSGSQESAKKVAITLTKDDPSGGWGDWHTAHELGDAFARLGWQVHYAEAYADRWYELPEDVTVLIGLLDRFDASKAPDGVITIAWIRNWTHRWLEQPWIGSYDVLIPSSGISRDLIVDAGLVAGDVIPLATNPERFHPQPPNAVYESDYVFTGNHWGAARALVSQLEIHPEERFAVFGKGWEKVPTAQRYWRGALPYDDLPIVYSSTRIVLDDTAGPTLPYGALNSRVFDALGSGALVITNNRAGSDEFFDGRLPYYESPEELRTLIDRYLGDDELRKATAKELHDRVVAQHTYDNRANQFLEAAIEAARQPIIAIKTGVPNREEEELWGDTHFARAFGRALGRLGYGVRIDILPEWDSLESQVADIVVHLRGLSRYVPKPGQFNVLWVISHPDEITASECEMYDLVLVASDVFAAELADRVEVPVVAMLQASEFGSKGIDTVASDGPIDAHPSIVFVGNSRGIERHGLAWAIDQALPVVVHGADWSGIIPDSYVASEHVTNEQLPAVYRGASIVLNDHWRDMADHGFISNRVFDVLATGGVVVSDEVAGLEDVFGEIVPTYSSAAELRAVAQGLLEDEERRESLGRAGAAAVEEGHTFVHRAAQFHDLIDDRMQGRDDVG